MAETTIAFEGAQTIANAEDACGRLRAAFEESGDLRIDLSAVIEADLAFVQLLLATRRRAKDTGRGLRVDFDADGPVAAALGRGGLAVATIREELPSKGGL